MKPDIVAEYFPGLRVPSYCYVIIALNSEPQ